MVMKEISNKLYIAMKNYHESQEKIKQAESMIKSIDATIRGLEANRQEYCKELFMKPDNSFRELLDAINEELK